MNHVPKDRPGVREQQLLRKMNNPLFGEVRSKVGKDDLAQARLEDGVARVVEVPVAVQDAALGLHLLVEGGTGIGRQDVEG